MPQMRIGLSGGGPIRPPSGGFRDPKFRMNGRLYVAGVEVAPQTLFGIDRTAAVFGQWGYDCHITSVVRGRSLENFSLHPYGYAWDAVPGFNMAAARWEEIRGEVEAEVGEQFQIIVHDAGSGMHLHGEFDPLTDPEWVEWKTAERILWERWKESHGQG